MLEFSMACITAPPEKSAQRWAAKSERYTVQNYLKPVPLVRQIGL